MTKVEAVQKALQFMKCDDGWKAESIKENEEKYVISLGNGKESWYMPIAVNKKTGVCSTFNLGEEKNQKELKEMV